MDINPTEIVRRLQGGDSDAFREILEAFQARIRGLIAHMGLQSADVDDVAQETFLHAFEHINEFEAGTNLRAWLTQIARYKTLSFLERAAREAKHRNNAMNAFMAGYRKGDHFDEGDEAMDRLQRCMDRLDEKARTMVEKRYAGVSIADLAAQVGRSVDAIKMQLFRTRIALKKCVETIS